MEWFRVEENRLPKEGEDVLIFNKYKDIEVGSYIKRGDGVWYTQSINIMYSSPEIEEHPLWENYVTHWSYLPEGPYAK